MSEFIKNLGRKINWGEVLRFLIAFSPAILLAVLVAKNAVNVPVWDGWERVAIFEKVDAGTLSFADLYAPHIDHRMVFPRLIWIVLGYLSDGDLRFEVVATQLVGFAAGVGFWKLARYTVGKTNWSTSLAFLANLWIFSPLQYDNWLWPIQTSFMIPMTCLIWAIWVTIQTDWKWWTRWLCAAGLAIVGTHSFSHGIFIWPTVAGVAILGTGWRKKERYLFLGLWISAAAIIIGLYFGLDFKTGTEYSYGREKGAPPPIAADIGKNLTENREKCRLFFLRMLGAPLVRQFATDPLPPSREGGITLLIAYGICGIIAIIRFRKKRDPEEWSRVLPWFALGGAVIAIALGVASGRASLLAEARATVPRLMSVALYLPLSLLVIFVLARPVRKLPIVVTFLIALQIQPWLYGERLMDLWRISRIQAQSQLMFIEHFDPVPSRILAYQPPIVKRYAPFLDSKDWLDYSLVKTLDLDQFRLSDHPLPSSKGRIIRALPVPRKPDVLELTGIGVIHQPTRPADAILITAEWDDRDSPKIIGLGDIDGTQMPTRYRIDLQFTALWELAINDPGTWMRWREEISLDKLPKLQGPVTIRAWVFNLEKRKAYPMAEKIVIDGENPPVLIRE